MLNRTKSVIKPSAGILLVALLLCLLLLSCAEELPEPEELASNNGETDEGKIAFVSDRGGSWGIYVMNPDGTDVKYLTPIIHKLDDYYLRISWSPDRSKILFGSDGQPYAINADGTGKEPALPTTLFGEGFCWSPDGTKIAYHSWDVGERADIYVINTDGTGKTRLTHTPTLVDDWYPAWSPDGTKIAFSSYQDAIWRVNVIEADGTNHKIFTEDNSAWVHPSWFPDGTKIALAAYRDGETEIFVMNSDGTNLTRLTYNKNIGDGGPSCSPDGTKIVFASNRDGNGEIYVMNADGTDQKRLTYNDASDRWPSWSPFLPDEMDSQ